MEECEEDKLSKKAAMKLANERMRKEGRKKGRNGKQRIQSREFKNMGV